jgi:hypothetical protein
MVRVYPALESAGPSTVPIQPLPNSATQASHATVNPGGSVPRAGRPLTPQEFRATMNWTAAVARTRPFRHTPSKILFSRHRVRPRGPPGRVSRNAEVQHHELGGQRPLDYPSRRCQPSLYHLVRREICTVPGADCSPWRSQRYNHRRPLHYKRSGVSRIVIGNMQVA